MRLQFSSLAVTFRKETRWGIHTGISVWHAMSRASTAFSVGNARLTCCILPTRSTSVRLACRVCLGFRQRLPYPSLQPSFFHRFLPSPLAFRRKTRYCLKLSIFSLNNTRRVHLTVCFFFVSSIITSSSLVFLVCVYVFCAYFLTVT